MARWSRPSLFIQSKKTIIKKGDPLKDYTQNLGKAIKINEGRIQDYLGEMVSGTVEKTLDKMLDAEADKLCNAERYQRTQFITDTRAGYYQRNLHTKAGKVKLSVPRLRQQRFETAIIERYKPRESSSVWFPVAE